MHNQESVNSAPREYKKLNPMVTLSALSVSERAEADNYLGGKGVGAGETGF